jgi:DNA polymerase-3 subunit gamma/tau
VVGQEHVTEPLSTALDTGRISHAYLFSGPRGCGKTSSARILARSLNCAQGPTSRPCGVCPSCVALAPGGPGNLDVIELDAASHGGVDDTRELRDRAFYAPAESRYRVFIVDEAHMVTTAGFNALLKIVEEPPAHLIFVFATTEPDKVLATIRSRTHHYPFRLLPPATMRGLLGKICEQEHVPVEEAVYPLVIRAGGGSPRDSLSVLDQLLAGAGPEGVTYPRALSLLGVTDIALIDDAVEALAGDDGAALFGTVDRVVEAGHDPRRFAGDLLERMRDLILLRAVPDAAERNLVTGPGDVLERMRDQAQRLGPAALARYAELLHTGLGEMRGATAPRLLLEVVCARMLLPVASDAESATLQRLERLERQMAGESVPPSTTRPASATRDSETQDSTAARPPASAGPESGPPRRRGAEALAAIRGGRSGGAETGGSPAAPEPGSARPVSQTANPSAAADAPGETARPDAPRASERASERATGVPEQRPHPAQRAQTPVGPESARPRHDSVDSTVMDIGGRRAESAGPQGNAAEVTGVSPSAGGDDAPSDSDSSGDVRSTAQQPVSAEEVSPDPSGFAFAPGDVARQEDSVTDAPGALAPDAGVASRADDDVNASKSAAAHDRDTRATRVEAPATATGGTGTLREIEAAWPDIRSKVREFGAAVHALLSGASVARLEGDTVVLAHQHAPLAQRLSNPKYVESVQSAIQAVLGRRYEVRWEVGAGASAALARPQEAPGRAAAPRQSETPKFTRPSQARDTAQDTGPGSGRRHAPDGGSGPDSSSSSGTVNRATRRDESAPSPDDDIPLPDGPDLPDDPGPADYPPVGYDGVPPAPTPEEEREMLAESAVPVPQSDRRDPDEVALELLGSELGATRLEA